MDPRLFTNTADKVVDDLRETITPGSRLSIAAASFSLFAFETLKKELEKVESLRFIFTSPTFAGGENPKESREFDIERFAREQALFGSEFELKLRNQLNQKAIAVECAEWIRKKAKFCTNTTDQNFQTFLHVKQQNDDALYTPFNDFSAVGLGIEKGNNIAYLCNRISAPMSNAFINTFNECWNDFRKFEDVTQKVIDSIATVYKENSPNFIYFVTLYNIFHEFLTDISEDVLPNSATGFKESAIWKKMFNFQKDAALAIINKLEMYNGCILADSVGLGKTFTALGVIKYYEQRNKDVLVLCPKKLNNNWVTYKNNQTNNPVASDRFRYDVLYHSDLSRESGYTNSIDLSRFVWSNYDLVVIDESHNFRNGGAAADCLDEDIEDDSLKIINNGKTSVMLTHGLETYDGDGMKNMFGASDDVNLDMTYQELNANLHPGSSVKIFSCFSNLSDDFSNVTPARQSLLGVPFIADYNTEVDGGNGAADAEMYLELQYERDNGYYYEAY